MAGNKLLSAEKKFLHSVSWKAFLSYYIYIVIKIVVTFILPDEIQLWATAWFFAESFLVFLGIVFAVDKASFKNFATMVRKSLTDGSLSGEEAMSLLREGWFLIMGLMADQARIEVETKETKEKKKTLEEIGKNLE